MKNALGEEVTIEELNIFFAIKRKEYEYAEANGLETLKNIIRDGVKRTAKKFNYNMQPGKQQTLF